jgi:hypothetical protein
MLKVPESINRLLGQLQCFVGVGVTQWREALNVVEAVLATRRCCLGPLHAFSIPDAALASIALRKPLAWRCRGRSSPGVCCAISSVIWSSG